MGKKNLHLYKIQKHFPQISFVNAKAMKIIRKLRLVCGFNQTTYLCYVGKEYWYVICT